MALSTKQRKALEQACPQNREGTTDGASIADKIDDVDGRVAAAVADIADTSTATAEDVGNKVNALLAALRTAGLLAE